jgi:hypothetical protein
MIFLLCSMHNINCSNINSNLYLIIYKLKDKNINYFINNNNFSYIISFLVTFSKYSLKQFNVIRFIF